MSYIIAFQTGDDCMDMYVYPWPVDCTGRHHKEGWTMSKSLSLVYASS